MPAEVSGLRDRVVVITGAARGMGRAYAEAFLEHGACVVGLDRAWDASTRLPAASAALTLECDVARPADISTAFERTMDRFGTVDVLIFNLSKLRHAEVLVRRTSLEAHRATATGSMHQALTAG